MSSEDMARAELRAIREVLEGLLSRLEGLVPNRPLQEAAGPQGGAASDPGTEMELRTIVEERWNAFRGIAMNVRSTTDGGAH